MAHDLDITIPIIGLGVVDKTESVKIIKKQLHLAIIRGVTKAVVAAIHLAKLIVPESHPDDRNIRPYPDSYETEQLMNTYIDMLNMSLTKLKRGKTTLRKEYTIQQLGWDMVSYAQYVNDMRGVNWTKGTSESGFIESLDKFLCRIMPVFIDQELRGIDRGQQLLLGEIK